MNVELNKAYEQVVKFNTVIGSEAGYRTLLQKTLRVLEEVNETLTELATFDGKKWVLKDVKDIDKEKLLIEGVDVFYTAFALPKEYEALGYEFFPALLETCENNNTKFVNSQASAKATAQHYEKTLDIPVEIRYNPEYNVFAVVDKAEGKLRKPVGYKSNTLKQYIPKEK